MPKQGETNAGRATKGLTSVRGGAILAIVILAILSGAYFVLGGGAEDIPAGTTFMAKRGDLDVVVVEGGSIEALESQEIRSQIKGHTGVKILTIIEEGYLVTPEDVENGKILVELDSADLEDKLVNQEIAYQSAEANFIEQRANFDIQVNQNQSNITAAELTAKFALMDFEKFLGKTAVTEILENLNLDERAEELVAMKARGGAPIELPEPNSPTVEVVTKGTGGQPAWSEGGGEWSGRGGSGGSRGGRGERGASGERAGSAERGAAGGFGGGGGMDPEQFRQMIQANGGQLPEAMAERMRSMGMDPNMILERMGISPSGEKADAIQELSVSEEEIEVKQAFTNEPEYIAAREALDFSTYADVEILEDGEAKQQLRELEDMMLVANSDYRLSQTRLEGQEKLAVKDFITQNELDLERVNVEKARIQMESRVTERALYIQYTFEKQAEQLLSDYEEALMSLDRAMQEARAKLSQAEVGYKSAEQKYNIEDYKLADLKDQIQKCTIRAERTGLVVYGSSTGSNPFRRSSEEPIQDGTTVRERQRIITIPDMTKMGVTVNIHESAVQKVAIGQTVSMRMDAFPDRELAGAVERVAVLADSANMFMNPDLKVYPTVVRIEGVHDWLRPGMSAQVEILVTTLEDVVYIPIQAVSYFGDDQVCYVVKDGRPERRVIQVGQFTDEYIEVQGGLDAGDEVLLLAPGTGEQEELNNAAEEEVAA